MYKQFLALHLRFRIVLKVSSSDANYGRYWHGNLKKHLWMYIQNYHSAWFSFTWSKIKLTNGKSVYALFVVHDFSFYMAFKVSWNDLRNARYAYGNITMYNQQPKHNFAMSTFGSRYNKTLCTNYKTVYEPLIAQCLCFQMLQKVFWNVLRTRRYATCNTKMHTQQPFQIVQTSRFRCHCNKI